MRPFETYFKWGAHQSVAYTATAGTIAETAPDGVFAARVWCTTAAFVRAGRGVTATASDVPVAASTEQIIQVAPGWRVSAVQQAAGGNLHVTWLTH